MADSGSTFCSSDFTHNDTRGGLPDNHRAQRDPRHHRGVRLIDDVSRKIPIINGKRGCDILYSITDEGIPLDDSPSYSSEHTTISERSTEIPKDIVDRITEELERNDETHDDLSISEIRDDDSMKSWDSFPDPEIYARSELPKHFTDHSRSESRDTSRGPSGCECIIDKDHGSLAIGYDLHNKWEDLPRFSLFVGAGCHSEEDFSVISGIKNRIIYRPDDNHADPDNSGSSQLPSGNVILAGLNNEIIVRSPSQGPSAIIASSNVTLDRCQNTIALGLKDVTLQDLNDAIALPNLQVQETIRARRIITNDLHSNGQVQANTGIFNEVVAANASFQTMNVINLQSNSHYVEATGFALLPGDGIQTIYANPINGDCTIYLGVPNNNNFELNRTIVIKDITLEYGTSANYNVYVWVPDNVRIENYPMNLGGYTLTATPGGAYMINTSGGCVTFKYCVTGLPGALSTWCIQSQFLGNPRGSSVTPNRYR